MDGKEEDKLEKCKHVAAHACGFKGKPTIADCLFCLPTSAMSSYRHALIALGETAKLPFRDAYMVYNSADSARCKSSAYMRLMEKHRPKIHKRGIPRQMVVVLGPHPIEDEDKNPLTV